jgi:very-short-patch-repair endonuclease
MTKQTRKELLARLATRQAGQVSYGQLARLGIAASTIHTWEVDGYLRRALPCVFSVGHGAPSWEASLWAAVLYAGPGAMLSHATAARWCGYVDHAPQRIEVSTPRAKRSLAGVRVYGRRERVREFAKGIPVTTTAVTMLDLAGTSSPRVLRRALGQLDFHGRLDIGTLLAECRSGRPGAAALRAAIDDYDPRRKYANGRLEEDFLELCRRHRLPLPRLNCHVHEIRVDAYWPQQGLIVELDGRANHSSPAQLERDRRNDMLLRSHGLTVIRYDWRLVHQRSTEVWLDLRTTLERLSAPTRRTVAHNG